MHLLSCPYLIDDSFLPPLAQSDKDYAKIELTNSVKEGTVDLDLDLEHDFESELQSVEKRKRVEKLLDDFPFYFLVGTPSIRPFQNYSANTGYKI
jgi:hypothetical protein